MWEFETKFEHLWMTINISSAHYSKQKVYFNIRSPVTLLWHIPLPSKNSHLNNNSWQTGVCWRDILTNSIFCLSFREKLVRKDPKPPPPPRHVASKQNNHRRVKSNHFYHSVAGDSLGDVFTNKTYVIRGFLQPLWHICCSQAALWLQRLPH